MSSVVADISEDDADEDDDGSSGGGGVLLQRGDGTAGDGGVADIKILIGVSIICERYCHEGRLST